MQTGLHPEFLGSSDKPPSSADIPIFHVTDDDFTPSLLAGEIERIDNLLTTFSQKIPPASLKEKVMGDKSSRPAVETWMMGNVKSVNVCANCGKQQQKTMAMCSR